MESPGWKTYRFDFTEYSFTGVINSNGNVIDDVIAGPYGTSPQYYTFYSYKNGLLNTVTDEKHRKTSFEYDAIGRLKVVKDQDGRVVKVYDYHFQAPSNGDSVWVTTGITRCKPCPQNETYNVGIQQREEKDTNPQSTTYNQTRWVDAGSSPNCVITADWQNSTTPIRCRQVSGYVTGEQEQEQIDKNPCSPTFNSTRWTPTGTYSNSCPLPPVHPALVDVSGVLYIKLFANPSHTIPLYTQNLTVNYIVETRRGNGTLVSSTSYSVVCNGNSVALEGYPSITYGRDGVTIILQTIYKLVSGTGYVIP